MSCPKNMIRRSGYKRKAYTRKDGTRVKATYVKSRCIIDRGLPGKGPKLIGKLKKGALAPYSIKDNTKVREEILRKKVKSYGALDVFRKLNAVATLQKNTNPANSRKFIRDRNWVRRTFASQFKTPLSRSKAFKRRSPKKSVKRRTPKKRRSIRRR